MKQKPEPLMRILAVIIDSIIILPIIGILVGIGIGMEVAIGWFGGYVVSILTAVVSISYFLCRDALPIEALNGASVGKKLLGFRAETMSGQKLSIEESARRNAIFVVGSAIGLVGTILGFIPLVELIFSSLGGLVGLGLAIFELVMLFQNPDGRRWGDNFADTMVVNMTEGAPTQASAPPPAPGAQQGSAPPPPPPGAPQAAAPPPPPPGAAPPANEADEKKDAPPPPPPGVPNS